MSDYELRFRWPGTEDEEAVSLDATDDADAMRKAAAAAILMSVTVWWGERFVGGITKARPN